MAENRAVSHIFRSNFQKMQYIADFMAIILRSPLKIDCDLWPEAVFKYP